jgi:hypothetical protein
MSYRSTVVLSSAIRLLVRRRRRFVRKPLQCCAACPQRGIAEVVVAVSAHPSCPSRRGAGRQWVSGSSRTTDFTVLPRPANGQRPAPTRLLPLASDSGLDLFDVSFGKRTTLNARPCGRGSDRRALQRPQQHCNPGPLMTLAPL